MKCKYAIQLGHYNEIKQTQIPVAAIAYAKQPCHNRAHGPYFVELNLLSDVARFRCYKQLHRSNKYFIWGRIDGPWHR